MSSTFVSAFSRPGFKTYSTTDNQLVNNIKGHKIIT